jgi:surface protein
MSNIILLSGLSTETNYLICFDSGFIGLGQHPTPSPTSGYLINVTQWGNTTWSTMKNFFNNAQQFNTIVTTPPDLSNVTSMENMFAYAYIFNQSLNNWNTSNIINMNSVFLDAIAFNADISAWNTRSVNSMINMFQNAAVFNGNISDWYIGNVISMNGMFFSATSFNQNISRWNTSSVTDMSAMFFLASAFDQDISSWDMSKVTNAFYMLSFSGLSTDNYDKFLISLSQQTLQFTQLGVDGLKYCNGKTARDTLSNNIVFTNIDNNGDGDTYACYSLQANIFFIGPVSFILVNTGNESIGTVNNAICSTPIPPSQSVTCTYTGNNIIDIKGSESRNVRFIDLFSRYNFFSHNSTSAPSAFKISNTANVFSLTPGGNPLNSSVVLVSGLETNSNLTLIKSSFVPQYIEVGSIIEYQIQIVNIGSTTLYNVNLSDTNSELNLTSCSPPLPTNLSSGGISTCNYNYTITSQDINN